MNEMQSFIDETIDSRQITDAQIEDFYLGISGLGPVCAVEIERYVRTVDPDPMNPGEVRVTYVFTENNRTFSQGDKVKVRVHAISYTGAERLLRSTVGLWLPTIDYTFAGRVR
jgi:NADPH-dependent curcumin reductase CurA